RVGDGMELGLAPEGADGLEPERGAAFEVLLAIRIGRDARDLDELLQQLLEAGPLLVRVLLESLSGECHRDTSDRWLDAVTSRFATWRLSRSGRRDSRMLIDGPQGGVPVAPSGSVTAEPRAPPSLRKPGAGCRLAP